MVIAVVIGASAFFSICAVSIQIHRQIAALGRRAHPGVQPVRQVAAELGVRAVDGRQQLVAVMLRAADRHAGRDVRGDALGVVLLDAGRLS